MSDTAQVLYCRPNAETMRCVNIGSEDPQLAFSGSADGLYYEFVRG